MAILATVFLQSSASGDGILTGLHLAAAVVRSGRPLAELASAAELAPAPSLAP
jgi:phosphoglucosamine mutase